MKIKPSIELTVLDPKSVISNGQGVSTLLLTHITAHLALARQKRT